VISHCNTKCPAEHLLADCVILCASNIFLVDADYALLGINEIEVCFLDRGKKSLLFSALHMVRYIPISYYFFMSVPNLLKLLTFVSTNKQTRMKEHRNFYIVSLCPLRSKFKCIFNYQEAIEILLSMKGLPQNSMASR